MKNTENDANNMLKVEDLIGRLQQIYVYLCDQTSFFLSSFSRARIWRGEGDP